MRKPGIVAEGAARRHKTAKKAEPGDPRPDLVDRVFSVGERNRLRVGGMTCMPAREGRLCLAAAIDAFSRKAVGRPMPGRSPSMPSSKPQDERIPLMMEASSSMAARASDTHPRPSGVARTPMA